MALTLCNKKKGCSFWQQCAYVLHVEIAAVDDFINLRHPHIALLSLFPEWLSLIKQVWVKRGLHWNWKSPIYFKSPFTHRRLSNPQEDRPQGWRSSKSAGCSDRETCFQTWFEFLPDPNHVRNHAPRKLAKSPSPGLDGRMRATCSATLIGGPYNESSGSPGRSLSSVNTDWRRRVLCTCWWICNNKPRKSHQQKQLPHQFPFHPNLDSFHSTSPLR